MPIYQTTAVGPPQTGTTAVNKSALGKDDFLKLLTNQLRYQDPMNPLNGTEFAAQLAQFSSVEQLNNISTSLDQSINANYVLTQAINNGLSAGFVGKNVRASGDTFALGNAAGDTRTANLGYTLASAASTVTVKIKNEQGQVVRTLQTTGTDKGDNSFTWDGLDDAGNPVEGGTYTFTVDAKDTNGKSIAASQFFTGKVASVRFSADGTKFVIDGQEVLLGNILEILEG